MNATVGCREFLIIVVDEMSIDYQPLMNELRRHHVPMTVYSTGEDALRAKQISASTVWIVNIQLPDLSGPEFVALIRRRVGRCRIFLVGNKYSSADELTARAAGATGYLCKPATASWLQGCGIDARMHAIRAGPAPVELDSPILNCAIPSAISKHAHVSHSLNLTIKGANS